MHFLGFRQTLFGILSSVSNIKSIISELESENFTGEKCYIMVTQRYIEKHNIKNQFKKKLDRKNFI